MGSCEPISESVLLDPAQPEVHDDPTDVARRVELTISKRGSLMESGSGNHIPKVQKTIKQTNNGNPHRDGVMLWFQNSLAAKLSKDTTMEVVALAMDLPTLLRVRVQLYGHGGMCPRIQKKSSVESALPRFTRMIGAQPSSSGVLPQ